MTDERPAPPRRLLRKSDAGGRFSSTNAPGDAGDGSGIIRAALWGTAVFTVTAAVAAAVPDTFGGPALVLDVALFAAGCVLFALAFLRAADRSRTDAIGIGGLFFLAGDVAPPAVRYRLVGALAVQAVVGLATAGVRPYTNLAAGTLVPVFGLGLCGLWAARHGRFGPRSSPPASPKGTRPSAPPPS
jgi:hypothetical protein